MPNSGRLHERFLGRALRDQTIGDLAAGVSRLVKPVFVPRVTWRFVAVGKPKLPYALTGVAEYERRIRRFARVEWQVVPASDPGREAAPLLAASAGDFRL